MENVWAKFETAFLADFCMKDLSRQHRQPKVGLLIESSRGYGRALLRGIAKYARTHTTWSLLHQEMTIESQPPAWWESSAIDGVVARVGKGNIEGLRKLGLPLVDVRCVIKEGHFPQVETDENEVARLAFDHLYQLGFRRMAYCGFQFAHYSQSRKKYFLELAQSYCCPCSAYESPSEPSASLLSIEHIDQIDYGRLAEWLKSLQPPTGIFVCNDICGQQLLNVCRAYELAIPDDFAVIGVDDDDAICPLCDPPLSSVRPDAEQVGFRAAQKLDALINGQPVDWKIEYVRPLEVVQRLSTAREAITDREVAKACRFIRENAGRGIDVNDVCKFSTLSRRQLERRFQESLNRSPKDEITLVQIQKVKQLLRETDMTLDSIAALAGYSYKERLCAVFKREAGMTPTEYRKVLGEDKKE
jgi:LacI family transcriptional regulator